MTEAGFEAESTQCSLGSNVMASVGFECQVSPNAVFFVFSPVVGVNVFVECPEGTKEDVR